MFLNIGLASSRYLMLKSIIYLQFGIAMVKSIELWNHIDYKYLYLFIKTA